ncbi:MAG: hypothetical protein ABGY95_09400 [Rubritalea sp.]|uniref:hypothetical protein n=1 Tax=Rubritalea sp. TaxID=2109375 RepID=UPI0032428419
MPRGVAYLIAVVDWHTPAVLSWEVCNTMDTAFCRGALRQGYKWDQSEYGRQRVVVRQRVHRTPLAEYPV